MYLIRLWLPKEAEKALMPAYNIKDNLCTLFVPVDYLAAELKINK